MPFTMSNYRIKLFAPRRSVELANLRISWDLGKELGQARLIRAQTKNLSLEIVMLSREEGFKRRERVESSFFGTERISSITLTGQRGSNSSEGRGFTTRALNLEEGFSFFARKDGRGNIEKDPSESFLMWEGCLDRAAISEHLPAETKKSKKAPLDIRS